VLKRPQNPRAEFIGGLGVIVMGLVFLPIVFQDPDNLTYRGLPRWVLFGVVVLIGLYLCLTRLRWVLKDRRSGDARATNADI
jgi:hypothetical protein